jgi:hypothetical protein
VDEPFSAFSARAKPKTIALDASALPELDLASSGAISKLFSFKYEKTVINLP